MQNSLDVTTDPFWQAEQMDRLLGFEVLKKVCTADPDPVPPSLLADKIGLNKGFSHAMILSISQKLETLDR